MLLKFSRNPRVACPWQSIGVRRFSFFARPSPATPSEGDGAEKALDSALSIDIKLAGVLLTRRNET